MSLAQQFERLFLPKFERYADEAEKVLKQEVPVGETGALRDSITKERKSFGNYRVGVDGAKLASDNRNPSQFDYSPVVVNGHGGYTIRPVRAKALRWVGKDGRVHFAQRVYIPPASGNDFVARAQRRVPKFKF